ncbi:MAG: type II toxin-antitoxin system VapC family toxin [Candidatus Rokuibacteriota bacterium]
MHLVDTSVWVHALRPKANPGVAARLRPLIVAGQAAVTEWILLELITGLGKSESQESLLSWFKPVERLRCSSSWELAWANAARLRKRGISVTAADCLIATVAIENNVPLVHCDADFEKMKGVLPLTTEDWTPRPRR